MSVTAGGPRSPRGHMKPSSTVYSGLIRSVLKHQNFPCLKLIKIIILWVNYPITYGFSLFRHFWGFVFNFLSSFVWLRITDEGSVPEMRIWSIFYLNPDLKWCIHLSRSLLSYLLSPDDLSSSWNTSCILISIDVLLMTKSHVQPILTITKWSIIHPH